MGQSLKSRLREKFLEKEIIKTNAFFRVGDLRYSLEGELYDSLSEKSIKRFKIQIIKMNIFESSIQDMVDCIEESIREKLRRKEKW